MADDGSLKEAMGEQIRAQRERSERLAPARAGTIELQPQPAPAEAPAVDESPRRGLWHRMLRR